MSKPFNEIRERLLRAGVAPRHVRRYLAELADHFCDLKAEEERAGRSRADAESTALARLGGMDTLARALIEQRQFQSWSARAPWAVFGFAPLLALAAAWFVALFILWSGWQIFLPQADTPFGAGPVHGLANFYFQIGRAIYFSAPLIVGWGIGVIAARQRFKAIWPVVGLVVTSWMGGAGQVEASRTGVPSGIGHIRMVLVSGTAIHGFPDGLFHALVILSITVLPYLIWRLQKALAHSG